MAVDITYGGLLDTLPQIDAFVNGTTDQCNILYIDINIRVKIYRNVENEESVCTDRILWTIITHQKKTT